MLMRDTDDEVGASLRGRFGSFRATVKMCGLLSFKNCWRSPRKPGSSAGGLEKRLRSACRNTPAQFCQPRHLFLDTMVLYPTDSANFPRPLHLAAICERSILLLHRASETHAAVTLQQNLRSEAIPPGFAQKFAVC
jgi:hypothetical protein